MMKIKFLMLIMAFFGFLNNVGAVDYIFNSDTLDSQFVGIYRKTENTKLGQPIYYNINNSKYLYLANTYLNGPAYGWCISSDLNHHILQNCDIEKKSTPLTGILGDYEAKKFPNTGKIGTLSEYTDNGGDDTGSGVINIINNIYTPSSVKIEFGSDFIKTLNNNLQSEDFMAFLGILSTWFILLFIMFFVIITAVIDGWRTANAFYFNFITSKKGKN